MSSKTLGWLAVVISAVALFVVLFSDNGGGGGGRTGNGGNGGSDTNVVGKGGKEATPFEESEIAPVTGEDVKRLPDNTQHLKGLVEITGRAVHAENGPEVSANFYYVTQIDYESSVKSRAVTPGGEIKVVETRRYTQCNDRITLSNYDMKLALCETLPIDQVEPYVSAVATLVSSSLGFGGTGGAVVKTCVKVLHTIDGISFKDTMSAISGFFGRQAPSKTEDWVDSLVKENVNRKYAEVRKAVQEVSGKTYVVTYYQDSQGKSMRVKFEREDKSPLTENERRILREMNVFLSCNVIPSTDIKEGDSWRVNVGDLQGVVSTFSGGNNVKGELTAVRLKDMPNGLWNIELQGGRVAVLNEDTGMEDGTFEIKGGKALATPDNGNLRVFEMAGRGKLRVRKTKSLFSLFDFVKRTEGDCDVRMTLTAQDVR